MTIFIAEVDKHVFRFINLKYEGLLV